LDDKHLYLEMKWCTISWILVSCCGDGMFLVDKGLSFYFLGISKDFLQIVGVSLLFHGYYCLDPWRSIREYTLHQDSSYFLLDKLLQKVARRSKRAYTLLDLPC
jgi:hypothetical protein